jgi:hypothetical protein
VKTADDPNASEPDMRATIHAVAVFVLAALAQLPSFDRSIVPMDEGHLAAVAMGLGDGLALYRDLHTGIFPGIYLLSALLFDVFGNDLVVARWAQVFTNASVCVCLWLAGLRVMPRVWAAVAPVLYVAVVVMSFPVLSMFNYSSLALALCVLSLFLTMRLLERGDRATAIALGATLALAVFSKQNFGALAFAAAAIGIFANRRDSALAERPWLSFLLPIAGAGIAVTAGFVVYFLATGTFGDFLHSTVIQLGGDQLESFNNPIPPIFGPHPLDDGKFVFLYSPPYLFNAMLRGESVFGLAATPGLASAAARLAYGLALLTLIVAPAIWLFGVGRAQGETQRNTRLVVASALLFFLGIFPSAIFSHLVFVLAPVLLALALCLARLDAALRERVAAASMALRGVTLLAGVMAVAFIAVGSTTIAGWFPVPLGIERASLKVSEGQAEIYRGAMAFVEGCADPGEAIFVAPTMPVVYFLTNRPNVSRYDLTIPGNVDGGAIVSAIESRGTRCIVYNPAMYPEFPPFAAMFPKLDRHLKTRFEPRRRIRGGGEVWLGLVPSATERRTR